MKRFIYFCLILVAPTFALAAVGWINLNPVTPNSLNQFVKETGLFKKSQNPSMKKTVLYSISAATGQHYSIYTMQPLQFYNKVTKYKTTEQVSDGSGFPGIAKGQAAIVHGLGLSLGGIFWPKEQMLVYASNGKVIYNNQIDITAVKPVSGHLFPLAVGNVLKFDFKRTHSRKLGKKTTVTHEIGEMTYKVIAKTHGFSYSNKKIPGTIYEIEVWETTNLHPTPYLTDIYEYSNSFHWYISDKYFTKHNQLIAWYRVKTWA